MVNYLLAVLLLGTYPLLAQQRLNERESAKFWAAKGQSLMQTGQYAEAYSAFQLGRSLGAPDMAAKMELAKKRNINNIQFRALLAEAGARAATDPTQSLRLLEYAHRQFPDSLSVLKRLGEIINMPDNWYYTLRASDIQASPRFTYLLAETDKIRLYHRQGDSLTVIHTFTEQFTNWTFSPDERYLLVSTLLAARVYALQGRKITLIRTINESIDEALFSPDSQSGHGAWLLTHAVDGPTTVHNLGTTTFSRMVVKPVDPAQPMNACAFSPGGRYLITPAGVWQLSLTDARPVPLPAGDDWSEIATHYSQFSGDDRHLFLTKTEDIDRTMAIIGIGYYRFSERGDSLRYVADLLAGTGKPRLLWQPFSGNSRYLTFNDSLFFIGNAQQELVRPVPRAGQPQPLEPAPTESLEFGAAFRFSPTSTHVLRKVHDKALNSVFQLWRIEGSHRFFVHQFTDKVSMANDVFSPDGRYLLSRHTNTDQLFRLGADTLKLVHQFTNPLRKPATFGEDGYPTGSVYFSPNSRYLLTYGASLKTADSLWQLTDAATNSVLPMHGFKNRLQEGSAVFSPDDRLLLTVSSGPQPASVWNLAEQTTLQAGQLLPPAQALFSPKGNYLLTNAPGLLWRVSDRRLQAISSLEAPGSLFNDQFSADERFLLHTGEGEDGDSTGNKTTLYSLRADRLWPVKHYWTRGLSLSLEIDIEHQPYLHTYQSGLFSPDGSQWLKSQGVEPTLTAYEGQPQPDTLWHLRQGLAAVALLPARRIDRYSVKNPAHFTRNGYPASYLFDNWYSRPAALFSRNGRFLLTTERDSLQFYQLKPTPVAIGPLAGQRGFPIDVSARGDYWLTGDADATGSDNADTGLRDTPDTVRIWQRTGPDHQPVWKAVAVVGGLYPGLNLDWQGTKRQRLFSPSGNYLLLPTVPTTNNPDFTTLVHLVGNRLRPVYSFYDRAPDGRPYSGFPGKRLGGGPAVYHQ